MFYREVDGTVPVLEWLRGLDPRVIHKCRSRLELLQLLGHEMRRPEADYIGDGIYELRLARAGLRYRVLYGFVDRKFALLLVAFAKSERRIPASEIRLARQRFDCFRRDPGQHSHCERDI